MGNSLGQKTPTEVQQEWIRAQAKQILGDGYAEFRVDSYHFFENIKDKITELSCEITRTGENPETLTFNAVGTGVVDAFFSGMKCLLKEECLSLENIKFHSFSAQALINRRKRDARSNSGVKCQLIVLNSRKQECVFEVEDFSMSAAGIGVVKNLIEYFVNVEHAVLKLHVAIEDAKKRNRHDLEVFFTNQLVEMVKATSYEESIARIKARF